MNIYSIYRIVNRVNQKSYIGWTSRDPQVRFKEHLTNSTDKMVVSIAIRKYGYDHFSLETIYQTLDYQHSKDMEGFFISQFNSLTESAGGYGYNVDSGGNGHKRSQSTIDKHREKIIGTKQSEEWKHKRAKAVTGENNGMFGIGDKHPRFGKKISEETRRKISESQKARLAKNKQA